MAAKRRVFRPHAARLTVRSHDSEVSPERRDLVYGAKGQNRTGDTALFRRVLYRLSYLGPIVVERTALAMRSMQAGDADGARTHDLRRDRATL